MGGGVNPHRLCFHFIEVNMKHSCSECGSTEISIRLSLFWDKLRETWVTETFFWDDDCDTAYCHNCDTEIYLTTSFRYVVDMDFIEVKQDGPVAQLDQSNSLLSCGS